MIALIGIPTEPPLALVHQALDEIGAPHFFLNQREFETWELEFEITSKGLTGSVVLAGLRLSVDLVRGIYARPMDPQNLPEVRRLPADSPHRRQCAWVHDLLLRWMELSPGRVLNRPSAMASNSSKPYQAQLIASHGFAIPPTLITNDPDQAKEFQRQHGRVIYKSTSGARSIVSELKAADHQRLERIRGCPVQFQACIEGEDVRVHVIGQEAFAVRAKTGAIDYRYAGKEGLNVNLETFHLPLELRNRCVSLSQGLGLDFSGIDLKLTPSGEAFCFEVNPCPAFSYYERHAAQPISTAVARYLAETA